MLWVPSIKQSNLFGVRNHAFSVVVPALWTISPEDTDRPDSVSILTFLWHSIL